MVWRKRIVRGIVYGIVAASAAGALAYQRFTNPDAVRDQIIIELEKAFPGAEVSVDSAHLRILGGIQLKGLRFARGDDQDKHEFLQVPSAIFYHDKEKILDGELRLRKIELIRPRLRARRGRDGKWNLAGLVRPPGTPPDKMLPAIVIHQGTVILEDLAVADKATVLEINDVSLTLINDPLLTLSIRGAANSDLLGKLQLAGVIDRHSGETQLAFRAAEIPLTQDLAARLPIQCPPDLFRGLQLKATAHVEGKLSLHPDQPLFYEVRGEVLGAKLQHPKLLLPYEDLNIKFHCNNGELQLEKLTARSGKTEIEAHGMAQLPCIDKEFEVQLELKHVVLGRDLAERLPEKIRNLSDQFQPNGPTTIHIACARHEGEWVALTDGSPSQVSLRPEGIALKFKSFPYPLERATGAIDFNLHDERVQVDVTAYAGATPVFLRGHWTGKDADADVKFDFHANGLTIDDKLLHALPKQPTDLQTFAAGFHATGKLDVKAHIRHEPGKDFRNEYHLYFHDTAIQWDPFPLALKKVSGFINIYPDHWEFKQFQGIHGDGQVIVHGKSTKIDAKGEKSFGISLEITGRNMALDDSLRDALRPMPGLHNAWEIFNPQGNLCFTASVNRPTADMHDLDVHVDARGASVKPKFLPYLIDDITGQFRFHHHQLQITKLRAKHNQANIGLDHGRVDIDTRGGYYADLTDLRIAGFQVDEEFARALPKGRLQDTARGLKMTDPVRVATRLVIAQPPETGKAPDIYWDGKAWMYDARFTTGLEFSDATGEIACIGRVNGTQVVGIDGNLLLEQATIFKQPLKKFHAKFQMRDPNPDVLLVGVRAPMFGGDVVGQMEVNLNSAVRYEMNLTASQINLAEFGRHNLGPRSQLSGAANARLHVTGMGSGPDNIQTLDGNGAIDVPRGHLYNLPFLLDLLKFLGLHWPDRTAFEEFHTAFAIQGPKVTMKKFDLLGSAVSLSGKGEYDLLTKNVQVDVYPLWGRIEGLLPPMVRPLPTTLSKSLVTVEVRGKATGEPKDLKYQMKPMPVIVDPLIFLRDRMFGNGEKDSAAAVGEPRGLIVPSPPTVRGAGRVD